MLQARLDMRGMGRILRHIHYMGRYIQFLATPEVKFAPPWRTHSLFLSWLRVSTGKERARDHDCDLIANLMGRTKVLGNTLFGLEGSLPNTYLLTKTSLVFRRCRDKIFRRSAEQTLPSYSLESAYRNLPESSFKII